MNLINLTPHAVVICSPEGEPIATIPPSGQVARCAEQAQQVATIELPGGVSVPVLRMAFGQVEGLPEPAEGVGYIVSALVASAVPHRTEVFGVAQPVRNPAGQVVGARALSVR